MADDQPKVKLHWLNGSRAQGTLWLLEQLEIPYELEIYHRDKSMLAPAELAKLHPLGKSPVVTITPPGASEPIVLAESAFIVEYMCEHSANGKELVPKRWKDGQEGKIGGETEEWMRYQYIMYYSEGSFMSQLVVYFVISGLKGGRVPFFIRPISRAIANQVISQFSFPNLQKHFTLLESYLSTSPGGEYLCGNHLTGADIMLAFPLITGLGGSFDELGHWEKGSFAATFPKLWAYMQRLEKEPGWVKSVEKIREIEGSFSLLPGRD
ncbi:hypothetical protein QBC33DRAFT_535134 [Phialemonium atrogriseum]|uniref:Glutathione S-transferase n=1 Tax=Phialemonium atrogriseum TaxID=1093897 RepID=A0AAJ0C1M9_9PEZI|nr:uncharacterized protein QBC33DRAFT_535134 [Phialemonium atrogriseum]KAK1768485.1 hypothetical protein QBC33DRAFT_535134 [Phialemonium atrogriseum]